MIKRKGWARFVGTPMAAPIAVIWEFYANAREIQNGITFVARKFYTPDKVSMSFSTCPSLQIMILPR